MTAKELIAVLKAMPQDAEVIYSFHSEYAILNAEDVNLRDSFSERKFAKRNGQYMLYTSTYWSKNEKPDLKTVVELPGN